MLSSWWTGGLTIRDNRTDRNNNNSSAKRLLIPDGISQVLSPYSKNECYISIHS
ncbi:MAG TPA: hypothetical protein VIP70_00930 [Nitrososphaeraceae archaeon]